MRLVGLLAVPLCLAAGCALAAAGPRPPAEGSADIVYVNADHTARIDVGRKLFSWISTKPRSVQPGTREPILVEELHVCSTGELACLGGDRAMFALPRGKLSTGMKFSVGHTNFEITHCESADDCFVAKVAVRCDPGLAGEHPCPEVVSHDGHALRGAPYMIFTYNRFHGITAINLDPEAAGYEFVLQGERGILGKSPLARDRR